MLEGSPDGASALEPRLLQSAVAESSAGAAHAGARITRLQRVEHDQGTAAHSQKRLKPAQAVNAAFALFTAGFNNTLKNYVQSINEQSTNMVAVSATVTVAYSPPSAIIQVDNAAVFGPQGMFSAPVVANAVVGTVSLGSFTLTGSAGNLLIIDPTQSAGVALPVGTVLSASVPTSAQSSAASIFPSYITDSTIQTAIKLVKYFNRIPIKLPPENTPPHTPVQRGSIQTYVYESIAGMKSTSLYQYTNGSNPPSLQQLLLAIPLPTTAGSDLQIYESSVLSAIAESHQQLNDAIAQIFNRTLLVSAQPPANRLGENFNSSSSSGSSSSTSSGSSASSSSSSGSSSSSTG